MNMSEVIEEHRLLVGAENVHLSLGPKATSEIVREELRKLREKETVFCSFSELEQKKAEIARLRNTIDKIWELHSQGKDFFHLVDIVPDVDLDADTKWMQVNKEKGIVSHKEAKEIFD